MREKPKPALPADDIEALNALLRVAARWRDDNCLRALTHAARDPQAEIREQAIHELRKLGVREAIPAILPCLCDMALPVRTAAQPSTGSGSRRTNA